MYVWLKEVILETLLVVADVFFSSVLISLTRVVFVVFITVGLLEYVYFSLVRFIVEIANKIAMNIVTIFSFGLFINGGFVLIVKLKLVVADSFECLPWNKLLIDIIEFLKDCFSCLFYGIISFLPNIFIEIFIDEPSVTLQFIIHLILTSLNYPTLFTYNNFIQVCREYINLIVFWFGCIFNIGI
jgi:hypothetical protein